MGVKAEINRINNEFNENVNSHVFLVQTNNSTKALSDIKNIIKNVLNANEQTEEQINNENYIELIIIRPDGKEIKKDQILMLQERIKVKPILSKYIFYIIMESNLLNENSSNKLLKTIEEPNDGVIGFLISENNEMILPTIKSRCEMINFIYDEDYIDTEMNSELIEIAGEIVNLIETGSLDIYILYKNKKIKEVIKDSGKDIANYIKEYYNTACNVEKNTLLNEKVLNIIKSINSFKRITKKSLYLNKTLNKNIKNMNSELLLDKIFIELREVVENERSRS